MLNQPASKVAKAIRASSSSRLPFSPNVPIFTTVSEVREWRERARQEGLKVGLVPTMGALHQGHLDLISQSMNTAPLTIVSIFVNPTQFAPHEDLGTYPRTLPTDITSINSLLPSRDLSLILRGLGVSENERPSPTPKYTPSTGLRSQPVVVFCPSVEEMYPGGTTTEVEKQRGAFVKVEGYGDVMEGSSRPNFFRGVATVCTKLFNITQPDVAHFGQKDIQQALLLRIMLRDLHFAFPSTQNLEIHPTTRDPATNLALSSRNSYLSPDELATAPILYEALSAAKDLWSSTPSTAQQLRDCALNHLSSSLTNKNGVAIEPEYVEIFDPITFKEVEGEIQEGDGREAVIAGVMRIGQKRIRLLDNLWLGFDPKNQSTL